MRIVVIGNGVAGNSAAKAALRNPDTEVVLIEGDVTPYHSACVLPDYISGDITKDNAILEDYPSERFDRRQGHRVTALDFSERKISLADGSATPFNRLVLATGSVPFVPPVQGVDLSGNLTLKTLHDATRIRRWPVGSAVVIGSGLIGIEAAIALRKLGHRVTLMEGLDRIGPRILDTLVAEKVQQMLESHGIRVELEQSVVAVHGSKRAEAVETSQQTIEADLVLWATGMRAESSLAREAGIALGKNNGILVDRSMQTSVDGIYAAGDVVEFPDPLFSEQRLNLFWYFGAGQGKVAGMNAAGLKSEFPLTLQMGTARIFETPLAFVGYTERELRERGLLPEIRDLSNGRRFFHQVFLDGQLVGLQMIQPNRSEIYWAGRVLKIALNKPFKPWGVTVPSLMGS